MDSSNCMVHINIINEKDPFPFFSIHGQSISVCVFFYYNQDPSNRAKLEIRPPCHEWYNVLKVHIHSQSENYLYNE